jgi:hypothetical protein
VCPDDLVGDLEARDPGPPKSASGEEPDEGGRGMPIPHRIAPGRDIGEALVPQLALQLLHGEAIHAVA